MSASITESPCIDSVDEQLLGPSCDICIIFLVCFAKKGWYCAADFDSVPNPTKKVFCFCSSPKKKSSKLTKNSRAFVHLSLFFRFPPSQLHPMPVKLPCDVSSKASLSCCRFGSLPRRRRWQRRRRCNRRRTASAIRSFTTAWRVRSSRPKPTTSCPTLTRSVRFSVA